jgi:hypothetical protein
LPAISNQPPRDAMDKWARNARLYKRLKGEGLFVEPVYEAERPGIDYLIVSAGTVSIARARVAPCQLGSP